MSEIPRKAKCPTCGSTQDIIVSVNRRCAGCFGPPCSGIDPKPKRMVCHCGGTLQPTGRHAEFQCLTCRNVFEMTPDTALCDDRPERQAEKKEEFELRKREMRRKQAARF